jgi:hypothetical protein
MIVKQSALDIAPKKVLGDTSSIIKVRHAPPGGVGPVLRTAKAN